MTVLNERGVAYDAASAVRGPAWRAAEAAGVDMSLIEASLTKTPWERIQEHDRALAQVAMLCAASKPRYE